MRRLTLALSGITLPRITFPSLRARLAAQYAGVFALTIHPDVSGRPQVLLMLERLTEYINQHAGVTWQTMGEIAEDFKRRKPLGPAGSPECGAKFRSPALLGPAAPTRRP